MTWWSPQASSLLAKVLLVLSPALPLAVFAQANLSLMGLVQMALPLLPPSVAVWLSQVPVLDWRARAPQALAPSHQVQQVLPWSMLGRALERPHVVPAPKAVLRVPVLEEVLRVLLRVRQAQTAQPTVRLKTQLMVRLRAHLEVQLKVRLLVQLAVQLLTGLVVQLMARLVVQLRKQLRVRLLGRAPMESLPGPRWT